MVNCFGLQRQMSRPGNTMSLTVIACIQESQTHKKLQKSRDLLKNQYPANPHRVVPPVRNLSSPIPDGNAPLIN